MNSKTISPQEVSKALDKKDSGSVVVKDIVDGETDKTGGESLKGDCMPIEEEEDAAEVRRSLMFYTFLLYKFLEHKTYVEMRRYLNFHRFVLL